MISSLFFQAGAHQSTLARHIVPSAAPLVGDRELESGERLSFQRVLSHMCQRAHDPFPGTRLGEASNPGPGHELHIGTSNPSGLRSKESLVAELDPGIWTMAETQLSLPTQWSVRKSFQFLGRQQHRSLKCHFSAPVALRNNSDWAGSWGGVACISDFPSSQYTLDFPTQHWDSSRVLATHHVVGCFPILVCSFYGFPKGPTFPSSRAQTDILLEHLTKQVVFGYHGMAIIQGDFNHGREELQQPLLWQELGWASAQDLAKQRWGHTWTPTCKGATERDFIWISPALQNFFSSFKIYDTFMEHSTLQATFQLPMQQVPYWVWPLPSKIPWQTVKIEDWHSAAAQESSTEETEATEMFRAFSDAWETSLGGFVEGQPNSSLGRQQQGRGQRTSPMLHSIAPPRCRASRPGEAQLQSESTGAIVILWFKQLRRIQSYLHSIRKGQHHVQALTYRCELWSSILRARGFGDFRTWWENFDFGSPTCQLPQAPPDLLQATDIYHFFHLAFRKFEAWNNYWRNKQIQIKFERGMDTLFKSLKNDKPDTASCFTFKYYYTVTDVSADGTVISLDNRPEVKKN